MLLGFVWACFAQNTAQSTQTGINQVSTQTQVGSHLNSTVIQGSGSNTTINSYNQSSTNQLGNYHKAIVEQNYGATYNQAVINQKGEGLSTTDGNTAIINQTSNSGGSSFRSALPGLGINGTGNYGAISQQGTRNASYINQQIYSSGNYGSVSQYGTNNTQTGITQNKEAFGNSAQIQQGTLSVPVSGNKASVTQEKESLFNNGQIIQANNGNAADIRQRSISLYNTATIRQEGTNSQGIIEQSYTSAENKASLIQNGNNNKALIEQQSTSGGTGAGNTAELYQTGNNNLNTSILQNYSSANNKANLHQYGNNNNETRISQLQRSDNNKATIDMGGDGPNGQYPNGWISVNGGTAIIEQSINSYDNKARIGQSGDGHNARIFQHIFVNNSEAYIDQYPAGLPNTALIRQTNSTSSKANIVQNQNSFGGGNGNNLAEVFQGAYSGGLSSGNITSIIQENANNISRNEQIGTNNLALISQTGNGNTVAGLNADTIARQIGSDNKLYVTQNSMGGAGNMAHVSQIGTGNTAIINQTSN